jgi:ribosomal protein S18 acetylase RimI-like enzyme
VRADDWLAERFGHAVWWVEPGTSAVELRAHAEAGGPALYQAKVAAGDLTHLRELTRGGMTVVDTNLTLQHDLDPTPAERSGGVVEAEPQHHADVLEIAERDYDVSRFHLDPEIPLATAQAIKRDWIQAHLDGVRGDRLLVAEQAGRAAGFLAVVTDGGVRIIDAIAVRRAARGHGLGSALVRHLLASRGSGCSAVRVGTQASNIRSLRFYEDLGFRIKDSRYVLHMSVGGH